MVVELMISGCAIGTVLGLTGAGGGIIAVPALVFAGLTVHEAIPLSLLAIASSSAIVTVDNFKRSMVRYKAALLMAVCGILTTSLGVSLSQRFQENFLLILFAVIMSIVSINMLLKIKNSAATKPTKNKPLCAMDDEKGRLSWTPVCFLGLSSIGALSGFLTGCMGVGGGFVMIPSLTRLSNIPAQGIVATSLAVIAIVAGTAFFLRFSLTDVRLDMSLIFVAATFFGMLSGRQICQYFSNDIVYLSFACFTLLLAIYLFIKNVMFYL